MEFNVKNWLNEITLKTKEHFKDRVLFIGYHGSYKRGEATANSDIDMVIILDNLELIDLTEYKKIVQSMPYAKKACGFISGKKEIGNWSKPDIFQFVYETEPLYGNLNEIISKPSTNDIKQTIKSSAEALYHATCHSYLFSQNPKESLASLLKTTFFIQQAKYFLKTNKYIPTKKDLLTLLNGTDKIILENCINKNLVETYEIEKINELYEILIKWCSEKI